MLMRIAAGFLFVAAFCVLLGCGASNPAAGHPSVTDNAAPDQLVLEIREKINPQSPELIFRAYGDKKPSEYVKKQDDYTVRRIVVFKSGATEEKIQELSFPDVKSSRGKIDLIVRDVNFDGNKDILLRKFSVDTAYKCWLWDERQAKFIANEGFEAILNPFFDAGKKLIVSLPEFDFQRTQYTREYRFVNDTPTLIKETKSFVAQDEATVRYTVSELVNGGLQVTREYDEPNEIILTFTDKLHPSMSALTFKVYGKRKLSGGPNSIHFSANKIAVFQRDGQELIQEIVVDETWTGNSKSLGFIIEDMNFDGYKDIRIQKATPAGPNTPYLCWIWDSAAGKFINDKHLEGITAPSFDHDKKIITSFVRDGAAHHIEFIYRYIDDILTLIKVHDIKGAIVDGKKIAYHVIKELKDGELQVVDEYAKEYE